MKRNPQHAVVREKGVLYNNKNGDTFEVVIYILLQLF